MDIFPYSQGLSQEPSCLFLDRLLLLLLLEIRNRVVPTGSTPKGGPTEITLYHPGHSSPPGLVSVSVPSPPVLMSCILHPVRTLPCPPVLYIYPIESLVCFFLVFLSYTYIQTPQKRTPQQTSNPTYKLC